MSSSLLMTWLRVLQQKQKGVEQVSNSCDSFVLTISIKKTEVVCQPAPGKPYKDSSTLEAHCLELCTLMMTSMPELPKLVQHLSDYVEVFWDRSGIRLDTKLKVYRSVVLPTLLYACETWIVYQRMSKDFATSGCLPY